MTWDPVADPGAIYDVGRGDLGTLLASAFIPCLSNADFATAITDCILPGGLDSTTSDTDVPDVGDGFFYLVRSVAGDGFPGSYDNRWGPAQACGRDAGVNASPNSCP